MNTDKHGFEIFLEVIDLQTLRRNEKGSCFAVQYVRIVQSEEDFPEALWLRRAKSLRLGVLAGQASWLGRYREGFRTPGSMRK